MPSKPNRPKPKRSPSADPDLAMSASESIEFQSALRQTKVSLGMDFAYFGFLLVSLVSVLDVAAPFALGNHSRDHFSAILLLTMMAFGAGILSAIGKLLCLTAPRPLSDMSSILFAGLCDVGAVAASIGRPFAALQPELTTLLTVVAISLSALGFVCFVWFLRQLGECLGEPSIQERASSVLDLASKAGWLVFWRLCCRCYPNSSRPGEPRCWDSLCWSSGSSASSVTWDCSPRVAERCPSC